MDTRIACGKFESAQLLDFEFASDFEFFENYAALGGTAESRSTWSVPKCGKSVGRSIEKNRILPGKSC
jgi:hypothetical protein